MVRFSGMAPPGKVDLRVRMDDARYADLRQRAKLRGLYPSAYIRMLVYQHLNAASQPTTSGSKAP